MLISTAGELKIVDFGIAKAEFEGKESVTQSMVLGTRAYLAPERLDGAEDLPSSDVYALGLILYELVQGKAMSLSLNERYHSARLARRLFEMRAAGFTPQAWAKTRRLIAAMLSYEPEDRPTYTEIADTLARIMAMGALQPDLPGFARAVVQPIHRKRGRKPAKQSRHWGEVSFLHKPPAAAPTPPPPPPALSSVKPKGLDTDGQVRALLAEPRWETQLPALQRLLHRAPDWTEEPFIEILDQALAPRWKVWNRPPPKKLAIALEFLRQKPSDAARQRAAALATHSDRLVRATAKALLATR